MIVDSQTLRGSLSLKERELFASQGYLKIPGFLSPEQLERMKMRLQDLVHDPDFKGSKQSEAEFNGETSVGVGAELRKLHHIACHDQIIREIITSASLTGVLQSILGDSFLIYSDIAFLKPPHGGSRQPYHQDMYLGYQINPDAAMLGMWIALDKADVSNGCLRFRPGSHRGGIIGEEIAQVEARALCGELEDEVAVEAEAGDAILIDKAVHHASEVNASSRSRWAYSAFCVSCDASYHGDERTREKFVLLCGTRQDGKI